MTRRRFVKFVAFATALMGGVGSLRSRHQSSPTAAFRRAVYPDSSSAREVGRRYLSLRATPRDTDTLRIHAGLGSIDPRHPCEPAEVARLAVRRRTADFAAGRVVMIDGVVLARAEAALCALVFLDGEQTG